MKEIPQRHKFQSLSGVFCIDEKLSKDILSWSARFVNEPSTSITLTLNSGRTFEVNSAEEMEMLPFENGRELKELEIKSSSFANGYESVTVSYRFGLIIHGVDISCSILNGASEATDSIARLVKANKSWYSFLYTGFAVVPSILSVVLALALEGILRANGTLSYIIYLACSYAILFLIIYTLFPPYQVIFGRVGQKEITRKAIRKWLLGVLGLTLLAAYISGGYLKKANSPLRESIGNQIGSKK